MFQSKLYNIVLYVTILIHQCSNFPLFTLNKNHHVSLSLDLILFSAEEIQVNHARCLDGSAAGFYFKAGSNTTSWIIFLEGNDYCDSKDGCTDILSTEKGSSKYWPPWVSENFLFSSLTTLNPDFYAWMKVYVPYCSGDFYSGQHTTTNEWGVYFSGHNIIASIIDTLISEYGLIEATNVFLSGVSSGGVGVMEHSDYISSRLPQTRVKAAIIGGWFYPPMLRNYSDWLNDVSYNHPTSHLFKLYDSYSQSSCINANPFFPWLCGPANVGYLYQYVKTPMFVAQNMYDSDQLFNYLDCPINITQQSEQYMLYYGELMLASMMKVTQSTKFDGIFIPSCLNHTVDFLSLKMSPKINEFTFGEALGNWYFHRNSLVHLIDECMTPNCNADCMFYNH